MIRNTFPKCPVAWHAVSQPLTSELWCELQAARAVIADLNTGLLTSDDMVSAKLETEYQRAKEELLAPATVDEGREDRRPLGSAPGDILR